jgi:hypothetical protein
MKSFFLLPVRVLAAAGLIVLAAASAGSSRSAAESEKQKEALLDAENRWLASLTDPDALEQILAPDFIHALPQGFATKGEHIDYVRRVMSHAQQPKRHFEDLRVRVYGAVGIVNGIVVSEKENAPAKKSVFTDVFVLRDGHWLAVNAQENPFEPR